GNRLSRRADVLREAGERAPRVRERERHQALPLSRDGVRRQDQGAHGAGVTIGSMLGAVEQRLASSRLAALAALWILLVAQVIWTVVFCVRTRPAFSSIYYPVIFLPAA